MGSEMCIRDRLCRSGARPIGAESGLFDIRNRMRDTEAHTLPKGTVSSMSILDDFVAHVLNFVDQESLIPLNVVADVANGMGGLVVPAVFEKLPFKLDLMFGELDGTFPNHPADPLNPDNLLDLQERVLAMGADIGLSLIHI